MNCFDTYKLYVTLKLHFNVINFTFNGGKINRKIDTFNSLWYKKSFVAVTKKYSDQQLFQYFLSNIIYDQQKHIYEYDESIYIDWLKRIESLRYHFSNDMKVLLKEGKERFNKYFEVKQNHPEILKLVIQGKIQLETFIILQDILNFFSKFDKEIDDDIIWPFWKQKCQKYKHFLKIDLDIYNKIIQQIIGDTRYEF